MDPKTVRRKLDQLFVGFDENEKDNLVNTYPEKLITHIYVNEEKLSKKGADEDDDRNSPIFVICFTTRKNFKLKLHKVKVEKTYLKVVKTWELNELKSVESIGASTSIIITIGKSYKWTMDNQTVKSEFLFTLVKFATKYLKKPPKFININEEKLKVDLKMQPAAEEPIITKKNISAMKEVKSIDVLDDISSDESSVHEEKEPVLEIKEIELEQVLTEFDWQAMISAQDMEAKLVKELQELEAANVYSIIQSEDQANALIGQIDLAFNELDTIEKWLVHYTHVLDSMGADVHQVEVRNKTLQISAANQKLLLDELEGLMSKLKFPGYLIESLQNEPLEFTDGISQCEEATDKLMEMLQIKIGDLQPMVAVKEKMVQLTQYGNEFTNRLVEFVLSMISKQVQLLLKDTSRTPKKGQMHIYGHEEIEEKLFRLVKLIKWLKNFDPSKHSDLVSRYLIAIQPIFENDILGFLGLLLGNHTFKKPDDTSYLFTSSGAQSAPVANVKSTKKLVSKKQNSEMKKGISSSMISLDIGADEKISPIESFRNLLQVVLAIFVKEQNLILDLFFQQTMIEDHLSTSSFNEWTRKISQTDYIKSVDIKLQKKVLEFMNLLFIPVKQGIFDFWLDILKMDPMNTFGLLVEIEAAAIEYKDCLFNAQLLEEMYGMTRERFERFIQDQVLAISEIKLKKTGILSSFNVLPNFIDQMEYLLNPVVVQSKQAAIFGYETVLKALFQSLEKADSSSASEEGLLQILNIENMHLLNSELRQRKIAGLDAFVKQSKLIYDHHLQSYCQLVIRKPLGKLLEFFEGVGELLKSRPPEEVSFHLSFSKNVLREVLKKYPEKEMRKGIDQMYKRVQKNFTYEDNQASPLLPVVWRGIQEQVVGTLTRFEQLIALCYPEANLRLEFSTGDVLKYLGEIMNQ